MKPRLVFLQGSSLAGREIELTDERVTIGRNPGHTMRFQDNEPRISGDHAVIEPDEDGWLVCEWPEQPSTNGIYLVRGEDQRRITDRVRLQDGDIIEFGLGGPMAKFVVGGAPERVGTEKAPEAGALTEIFIKSRRRHGTAFALKELVKETSRRHSARLKWVSAVFAIVIVGLLAKSYLDVVEHRRQVEALRADYRASLQSTVERFDDALEEADDRIVVLRTALDRARQQLGQNVQAINTLSTQLENEQTLRSRLQQQLGAARTRLAELTDENIAAMLSFSQAEEQVRDAVYLLAVSIDGGASAFCTAFAVRPEGLLLTNAHCARVLAKWERAYQVLLERLRGRPVPAVDEETEAMLERLARIAIAAGGDVERARPAGLVIQSDHPGTRYEVTGFGAHARFDAESLDYDVGFLRVATGGRQIAVAAIAPRQRAMAIGRGDPIATLGFPGDTFDVTTPIATLAAGTVGRVLESSAGHFRFQHNMATSPGTSGSPIFDREGRVVAINNAGKIVSIPIVVPRVGGDGRVAMEDGEPVLEVLDVIQFPDGAGLNFGIRIDSLLDYINGL